MCGRTACTLSKEQLQRRCTYRSATPDTTTSSSSCPDGGLPPSKQPAWRDLSCSPPYRPGYNMPPGTFLPVLYSDPAGSGRLISAMKWGLVPSWVGRDSSGFSLHMSNARVETLMEKASFRNLVTKGRRCALLCEGFYEWKRPKAGPKQAYFFHSGDWQQQQQQQQPAGKDDGAEPPSIMYIAALYDVHKEMPGQPDLYSFTVVTMPASATVSDIHDRMPAILQTPDQISAWLQSEDPKIATACLKSVTSISFYPVSSRVNSTQHNDKSCLLPIKAESVGALPTLDKWMPAAGGSGSSSPIKKAATGSPLAVAKQEQLEMKQRPPPPDTGLTRWIRFGKKPQLPAQAVESENDAGTAAAAAAAAADSDSSKTGRSASKKPRLADD